LIAASHILFGAIICLVIFLTLRMRGIHSPAKLFYPVTLFMMEFPDLDHLYRMHIKLEHAIPITIWDLFKWQLRPERYPLTFLHLWIYPFILLGLLVVPLTCLKKIKWFIAGAFLSWTTHLVLDGVIRFL